MNGEKKKRESLIRHILDDISAVPNHSDIYRHCYHVIASLGLQLNAMEEGLFASEKWSIPECKDELMREIETFLIKHVR